MSTSPGPLQVFVANLDERDWRYGNRTLALKCSEEQLEFCRCRSACTQCTAENTVNFVHAPCLQLIMTKVTSMSRQSFLSKILQLTRPLLPWNQACLAMRPSYSYSSSFPSLDKDTSLGNLMAVIETMLPIEVQITIYSYVSGLFESLVRSWSVFDNHRRIVMALDDHRVSSMTLPLVGSGQIKTLHANAETILGETCLTGIGANHDSEKFFYKMIPVTSLPIQGVQVTLGMYGVVGLRILYVDGSESA